MVEGARLESVYRSKTSIKGSNPFSSASFLKKMSKPNFITQIKDDLASTSSAIAFPINVDLEFSNDCENNFFAWNSDLMIEGSGIILPEIKFNEFDEEQKIIESYRAALDMALCYRMFHDKKINLDQELDLQEKKIFDEFEKVRLIKKISYNYLGIVKNILAKIEDNFIFQEGLISMVLLQYLFADKTLNKTKNFALDLEKKLDKKVVSQIKNLSKKIDNQNDFAAAVAGLLKSLRKEVETQINESLKPDLKKEDLENFGAENIESKQKEEDFNLDEKGEEVAENLEENSEKTLQFKEELEPAKTKSLSQKSLFEESGVEFKNSYKIYSKEFDEVIFPQKLIAKTELESLRMQFDLKLLKLAQASKKMTLKLKRKLISKKNSALESDLNQNLLNRKKISRLVVDPFLEDVWISNKSHEYNDTALTILLDNSGSMRGNPIVMAAMACEVIAKILEKFAIKTEIIGFTTADWKGGRVRKLWESNGRIANPGRLNELRHIIYKSFNQNFKSSKINLGLMLKEGILKENIDGEALLFASSRLMKQEQNRKILMVISDGNPVDDSTISANDDEILSNHLRQVINKIEKQSKIEIIGVGIGHSTDDFYRNSIAIKSLEELGDAMIEKIIQVL